jgi:hypothetical protein
MKNLILISRVVGGGRTERERERERVITVSNFYIEIIFCKAKIIK